MEGHVLKEEKCQYKVRFCSNSLTGREGRARLEVKDQMEVRVTEFSAVQDFKWALV